MRFQGAQKETEQAHMIISNINAWPIRDVWNVHQSYDRLSFDHKPHTFRCVSFLSDIRLFGWSPRRHQPSKCFLMLFDIITESCNSNQTSRGSCTEVQSILKRLDIWVAYSSLRLTNFGHQYAVVAKANISPAGVKSEVSEDHRRFSVWFARTF